VVSAGQGIAGVETVVENVAVTGVADDAESTEESGSSVCTGLRARHEWSGHTVVNVRPTRVTDNPCSRLVPRRSAPGEYSPALRDGNLATRPTKWRVGRGVLANNVTTIGRVRVTGPKVLRACGLAEQSAGHWADRSPEELPTGTMARLWPVGAFRACGAQFSTMRSAREEPVQTRADG